ncbi:O-methylsterigmatocystin oxidoreductase [Salix suchowensis]|nr:O-methylsterigmatocystin oxidoreductase [Salix suchowensis]
MASYRREGDEYVALADEALAAVNQSSIFGQVCASWMPGAGFKKQAKEWRGLAEKMLNSPFDMANRKIREGAAEPCMMTLELEDWFAKGSPNDNRQTLVKNVAAGAYAAAVDTVSSAESTQFQELTNLAHLDDVHPLVVFPRHGPSPGDTRLGKAELDRVIPTDRLPLYSDRSELPIIDYLAWETMRWNPSVNIALAHSVTEDDEYRGYRIPKGTTILANICGIQILRSSSRNASLTPRATRKSKSIPFQIKLLVSGEEYALVDSLPLTRYGLRWQQSFCLPDRQSLRRERKSHRTRCSLHSRIDQVGDPAPTQDKGTKYSISRPKQFPFRLIPRAHKLSALSTDDWLRNDTIVMTS